MVSPSVGNGLTGNAVSASRWSRILRALGHRVVVKNEYEEESCDLLIALHAKKSANSVFRLYRDCPDIPVVVALTGTDLYRDIAQSANAKRTLQIASRLIVLHRLGRNRLPKHLRRKTRVIHQSVRMPTVRKPAAPRHFDIAVLANLRAVKDPFRAAMAVRMLRGESRVRVLHAGTVLEPGYRERAREEMKRNPRYVWKGALPWWQAKRLLARSNALVISSRMEGGANVVSEAAVAGVPVLASRIEGNVGLLGPRYPGYFPVGDTEHLSRLIRRVESDDEFHRTLRRAVKRLAPLFSPQKERETWERVLDDLLYP